MAACVYVSNPFTRSRLQVNNVDLQNSVAGFKNDITETIGIQANKQELIYMGGCLEDEERSLQSYGVESDVTIFVFQKLEETVEEGKEEDLKMSLEDLQAILIKARNPLYKQAVKKLIKSEEALQKAIKNITSLKKDPITSALIDDTDLLLAVLDSVSPESIVEKYPTLCTVFKNIVSSVNMDSSGRQLFPDDDDDGEFLGIDPSFIAQAELLAATEENIQNQQPSTSQQTLRPQQAARHRISASDLANALSFASMTPTTVTTPAVSASSNENQEQTEAALQQMRNMGITDDDLSRRALSLSGGIVEAALNLIFEGTLI